MPHQQLPAPLGSPFLEQLRREQPSSTGAIDLGTSMLSSKPKPVDRNIKEALAATLKKARQNAAKQFQRKPEQHTPAPFGGRSEMFVTESQPGTPDAAATFQSLKRAVEEKRRRGALGLVEEIEFIKAEANEKMRLLKKQSDLNYDLSDDDLSSAMAPEATAVPLYEEEDESQRPEKKSRNPKRKADSGSKPQPKRRRTAEDTEEDILEVARRKNAAKAKAKASKSTKTTNASGGGVSTTKRGRKPKYTGPSMLNSASMRGNDIFRDAAQNRDLPSQPTFDPTSRKDQALKGLIASVPEEFRPIAKADRKYLDDAIKNFTGFAAVKPADDGNWLVKGMKATLKHYQVLVRNRDTRPMIMFKTLY